MGEREQELLKKLRQRRDDYDQELTWHRFLLDAYTGAGGFSGKVVQPATAFLGWAAYVYSNASISYAIAQSARETSYLDRYPREDEVKFSRRRDVAHYSNYVATILDLFMGYLLSREGKRENTKGVEKWMDDVDGQRTKWDQLLSDVVKPRTALLGWMPMMFDMPPTPAGVVTKAQANDAGIEPRAIPLYPANLLDWECDQNGRFAWAKILITTRRRPSPLGGALRVQKFLIWYPDHVETYEAVGPEDKGDEAMVIAEDIQSHSFGEVPLVIWRNKPTPDDPVRGLGMVDTVALSNRRLFNLNSEFDEHLRQQVFALLQVPYSGTTPPAELIGGTDNAVGLGPGTTGEYKYIAPPGSVAATYETRIEKTIDGLYRMAGVENDQVTNVDASGLARAYAFEKTNRRLGSSAEQFACSEKRALEVAGRGLGVSPETLAEMEISPPSDFRIEDLATEIKNALDAITIELPRTAKLWLKKRVIGKLLPNLPDDQVELIEAELEQMANADDQQAAEDAAVKSAKAAAITEGAGGDGSETDVGAIDGGVAA